MRFIIRELSYETPVASGQLRYERNGEPSGAVESWRLTSAVSGYRFLRVDLDAREAPSGRSTLYHLVLNESGRPERLTYRYWDSAVTDGGTKIMGNVLLEEEVLTATREVNGIRYEDSVEFQAGCGFWFPSAVGLGLLANCAQGGVPSAGGTSDGTTMAVTLESPRDDQDVEAECAFALFRTEVDLSTGATEQLEVMGRSLLANPLNICWQDQERTIWLDEYNWPIKMRRDDGLTAVETRYIRYSLED
jgi:hypothetical protein